MCTEAGAVLNSNNDDEGDKDRKKGCRANRNKQTHIVGKALFTQALGFDL